MIGLLACTLGSDPVPTASPTTERTVTASLDGYGAYEGLTMEVLVTDRRDLSVAASGSTTVVGGSASLELEVDAGLSYFVDLWVDKQPNGGCDADDGIWHFVSDTAGDIEAAKVFGDASELNERACRGFAKGDLGLYDLQLTGFGYIVHLYEDAYMALIDDQGTAVAYAEHVAVNQSATWVFDDVVEPGVDYTVAFYLEHNGDGVCSDGDHAWFQEIGSFTESATVEMGHPYEPFDTDVCAYY